GGAGEALLQAIDRDGEPLALGRLQHVVDDALLEGIDGVLVVRRHEYDLGKPAIEPRDVTRRLDARLHGHPDVEENYFGAVLLDLLDRFFAVLRLRHY